MSTNTSVHQREMSDDDVVPLAEPHPSGSKPTQTSGQLTPAPTVDVSPIQPPLQDKGKATRTEERSRRDDPSEGDYEVDFTIYSDARGLENLELARKLLKATLLPKDWEVTKSRWLDQIADSYPNILKVSGVSFVNIFLR